MVRIEAGWSLEWIAKIRNLAVGARAFVMLGDLIG